MEIPTENNIKWSYCDDYVTVGHTVRQTRLQLNARKYEFLKWSIITSKETYSTPAESNCCYFLIAVIAIDN